MNTQSTEQAFAEWIESPAAREALNLYTGPNQLLKNITRVSWLAGSEAQKAITRKEVIQEIVNELRASESGGWAINYAGDLLSREAAREGPGDEGHVSES
jgi:hypothetical protein